MMLLKSAIDKIVKGILFIEGIIAVLFFVLVFSNIFLRFIHSSIIWAEQACRFMFAWSVCLGIPVVLRKRGHVAFDLLYKRGNPLIQRIIDLLTDAVALTFAYWLITTGIAYLSVSGGKSFEGIGLPYWVLYAVEPITGVLIIIVVAEHLLKLFYKPYRMLLEGGS